MTRAVRYGLIAAILQVILLITLSILMAEMLWGRLPFMAAIASPVMIYLLPLDVIGLIPADAVPFDASHWIQAAIVYPIYLIASFLIGYFIGRK